MSGRVGRGYEQYPSYPTKRQLTGLDYIGKTILLADSIKEFQKALPTIIRYGASPRLVLKPSGTEVFTTVSSN